MNEYARIASAVVGVGVFLVGCNLRVDVPVSAPIDPGQDSGSGVVIDEDAVRPVGELGGESAALLVVNPVVDEGTTTVDVEVGDERRDVAVIPGNMSEVRTDATGVALIEGLPNGNVPLQFENGTVNIDIDVEIELIDVVIAMTPSGPRHLFPPVHYRVDGPTVTVITPDDLRDRMTNNDVLIMLEPGVYQGPFEVTGDNVVIVGAVSSSGQLLSILEGDLTIHGQNVRLRNLDIDGHLFVQGHNCSVVFCRMEGATIRADNVLLMRNIFTGGTVRISGENVLLVDNVNVSFDPTPPDRPRFAGFPHCFRDFGPTTTAAVVVVDPVINVGTNIDIDVSVDVNLEVEVVAGDLPPLMTDETGLVVIDGFPDETVTIDVEVGQIDLDVQVEGDVFDVVVFRTPLGLVAPIPPIRHPGNRDAMIFNDGDDLAAAVADNNTFIILEPGTYPGPLTVTGNQVTIVGTCGEGGELLSTIQGDLIVEKNNLTIRGVRIEGAFKALGNNASALFCEMESADIQGNNALLLRNTFMGGGVTVTGNNALLAGNINIP